MGLIAGIAGAALVSGVASGAMQADSQRKAANTARDSQRDANLTNLATYILSRGGNPSRILSAMGLGDIQGGSAILPEYADQGTEKGLLDSAVAASRSIAGNPAQTLEDYQRILDQHRSSIDAGDAQIADIFNGNLEARRLGALDPVMQARLGLSDAQAQALEVALSQEQNRINAAESAKGYSGGGSFANNRLLQATLGTREAIATGRANAILQNASDVRGVKDSAEDLKIRSLDTPVNRVNQLIALEQAPGAGVAKNVELSQAPLAFFRLNPGNPPNVQPLPTSVVPSTGGLMLAGASQGLGQAGNFLVQQRMPSTINGNVVASYGYNTPSNWGGLSAAEQGQYINALRANAGTPAVGWE